MADKTNISWTDATWNPVVGCSHVSPGCEHCYAEALSLRRGWTPRPWGAQYADVNVQLKPERLEQPLHWKAARRVFVNSMSDLFHERIPDDYIDRVFGVMALAERHTFQILTKRPTRMREWFASRAGGRHVWQAAQQIAMPGGRDKPSVAWPLPNVWLGVSVEDQRRADERIPLLLETPAAIRFLSCEPLLARLDLSPYLSATCLTPCPMYFDDGFCRCTGRGWPRVDWVIAGGESGPGFRAMDLDWARSLRDQCQAAGVPYFFKQGSGPRPGMAPTLDGVQHHEWPSVAGQAR